MQETAATMYDPSEGLLAVSRYVGSDISTFAATATAVAIRVGAPPPPSPSGVGVLLPTVFTTDVSTYSIKSTCTPQVDWPLQNCSY